jgi:hypothetical protein
LTSALNTRSIFSWEFRVCLISPICSSDSRKLAETVPRPGFRKRMLAAFPDNVILAQILNQHDHKEWVGHGVQRPSVMGANVISIPPAQLHLDIDLFPIGTDTPYPDSRTQERRPDIQEHSHVALHSYSLHHALPLRFTFMRKADVRAAPYDPALGSMPLCLRGAGAFERPEGG